MNRKVASLESQMDVRVNEVVQLALSQQRGIAGSHPDVVISPASQRRSSYASMAAPDILAEQPQMEALAVEHQRYPVISPFRQHGSYMCKLRIYPFM